ncbi:MAG: ATP-binding protein [Bacteroides sp.]|nr:ATP-binding protein [Eubacterium sp.]MCM1419195.1 ATP-binding protein [Roseburia sp.]MCM1463038.1 ATP-binding protein [Bacteroides sp.]
MKKFRLSLKWWPIPLLIAAAALFVLFGSYTRTKSEKVYLTPVFDDPRGWEIYTVEDGERTYLTPRDLMEIDLDRTFYLTRILTQELRDKDCTLLNLNRPTVVFLDGEAIYTNGTENRIEFDNVVFSDQFRNYDLRGENFYCTLPESYVGKRLTLATRHTDHRAMPTVILSSLTIGTAVNAAEVSSAVIPAAGFAIAALLLLGLWLFAVFQGIRSYLPLLVIAAAMGQSFTCLRRYEYFSNAPTVMDSPFTVFVPIIAMILPQLYFLCSIKDRRSRFAYGGILILTSGAAIVLQITELIGAWSSGALRNGLLYLSVAALIAFAVLEAIGGNKTFRLFLGGAGAVFTVIVGVFIYSSTAGEGSLTAGILGSAFESNYAMTNLLGTALFLLAAFVSAYLLMTRAAHIQTDLAVQRERLEQLDHDLSAQKQFYESRLTGESELRALRHDMNGHLSTLLSLLRDGKNDEAIRYLTGVAELHNERGREPFSGDPYMNAVLEEYAAKCKEERIAFDCRIGIDRESLPGAELCLILNNALENAIEASLKLPEEERRIKVQAAVRQNRLLLRISNRFDGRLDLSEGLPVTEKSGKEHGYGLSNILWAARRRDGSMDYRTENGYFVLDVQLSLLP